MLLLLADDQLLLQSVIYHELGLTKLQHREIDRLRNAHFSIGEPKLIFALVNDVLAFEIDHDRVGIPIPTHFIRDSQADETLPLPSPDSSDHISRCQKLRHRRGVEYSDIC